MPTRNLSVQLTPDEKIDRAKTATELVAKYSAKEEEKKSETKALNDELKSIRKDLDEAARAARDGWEMREVAVTEKADAFRGTVDTIRLDTGEVIESRPMTPEERGHRQLSLVGS